MTAFTKAMLPDDIDTVEKVNAWATEVLAACYPRKSSEESQGNDVRTVSIIPFFNDTTIDRNLWTWQAIFRLSVPLTADYLHGGQIHTKVSPLGNASIPSVFLSSTYIPQG